ncbi:PAS domain S-box protein [Geomesophilobacter sediminis]|uniref:histidine kinase n=1 Tax=Geomesophilobacter sediminis TaxID=2798584 RepID=A0A8J7M2D1_9BACT|nr:PAS domain S-box protein [Geomesophilobacter sediminis]MBJ6727382.1 PAS domain S-box protein [Geomesophilobacter sediminis]
MIRVRLSLLIPLLVILSSLVSGLLLFWIAIHDARRLIEREGFNDLNATMTHLQNILTSQLTLENPEDAKLSLSVSALHSGVKTLLLADQNHVVLMANRYLWEKERAARVSGYDEQAAAQVMLRSASRTAADPQRPLLRGYYPVTLRMAPGGDPRMQTGVLFVEYDLTPRLAQVHHDAEVQAATFGAVMVAIAIAVAVLLHQLVSRRVAEIGAVAQRFTLGDAEARVGLHGSYELAEIGSIFDRMADKIAEDQRALAASERKISLHLKQNILGVIEWDREFRVREWNLAAEGIFGYSREEALERRMADLIVAPRAVVAVDEVWRSLLADTGGGYSINENVTQDGRVLLCEWFNTPLPDEEGTVTGVMSLVRDITEQRKMEESLRQREAELKESQRLAHIGSWDWDAESDVIWWSDECYRIYGFDPTRSLSFEEHKQLYTKESAERLDTAVRWTMESGSPYELDLELAHPSAATRWILARGEAKRDASGNLRGLRGTALNITERKQAEDELRRMYRDLEQSEERYRLVFESSPVSLWEEDFSGVKALFDDLRREGVVELDAYLEAHPEVLSRCAQLARVIEVNRAAVTLHGAQSRGELLSGLADTFTEQSYTAFREELVCLWQGGREMVRDSEVKTLAGEPRQVTVYFSVCPGYEESLGMVIVSLFDITARKQAEEALWQLNAELERRVGLRTAELEAKNRELERVNRLFIGRELRMVELKEQIRKLEQG